jgi:hypothetical protein
MNITITEEYLLKRGFKKLGRDDISATLSYEMSKLKLQPLSAHIKDKGEQQGYGAIWVKDEPNNVFSWRPLITLKYESDVETLIEVWKL